MSVHECTRARNGAMSIQYSDGSIVAHMQYEESDYTCSVCYELILDTIICCSNYHPLCSDCSQKLNEPDTFTCPTCRVVGPRTINYILMNLLNITNVKCSNNGCDFNGSIKHRKEHRIVCKYAIIQCPFCDKDTTLFDIIEHAKTNCLRKFVESKTFNDKFRYELYSDELVIFAQKMKRSYKFTYIILNPTLERYRNVYISYGDVRSILIANGLHYMLDGSYEHTTISNKKVGDQPIRLKYE